MAPAAAFLIHEGRDRERLLTVVALYLLPISIGLRTPTLGPSSVLMFGLAAIVVSKVVHLREAVLRKNRYPPALACVDLALVLDLSLMFQCLATPTAISLHGWTWESLAGQSRSDPTQALRTAWVVFWVGGLFLFGLIFAWTIVVERTLGLKRIGQGRYLAGWFVGAVISAGMAARTAMLGAQEVFGLFRLAAIIGFVLPAIFLVIELGEDALFEEIGGAKGAT